MDKIKKDFEELLKNINYKKGLRGFLTESGAIGFVFFIIILYLGLFESKSEKIVILSFFTFLVPFVINYFYKKYLFEAKKKKIENDIPDMLLIASSIPYGAGVEKIISFMAETDSELGEEFKKAESEIDAGSTIESAFERMKNRNKSLQLNRALDLILNSLILGADMKNTFRETAEDFIQTNSIFRERSASMTIEKYTLLLAGGIIVPLVLGMISGLVSGFNFSAISEIGIGLTEVDRNKLVEACLIGNMIYIAEYALIASFFVAMQEGNSKKAVVYSIIILPLSFIAYFFGKTI